MQKLTNESQVKVAFVLLLQHLRTKTFTYQKLSKKKREEVDKFLDDQFLDTLALLKVSNDALYGAQNYVEGLAESDIIPYSQEYWDRVSFILHKS